jgi:ubiquinone biosynthesis protein
VRLRLLDAFRDLNRARQVLQIVVFKYGFYRIAAELGLVRVLPFQRWRLRAEERFQRMRPAERLRLAMADLGPAFIKLAQALSTRADFVPRSLIPELRRLQDDVPAIEFDRIGGVLREELGPDWRSRFAAFDSEPIASASIGQVYGATLADGTSVTVKVQRPGVAEAIELDLGFLADLAELIHRRMPAMRRYRLPDFAREFADTIHDELNYTIEAHNCEVMAGKLAGEPGITVARVIPELSTGRVLTSERVTGAHLDADSLRARGHDPVEISNRYALAVLTMIFEHGFFQGDPHQGNVIVLDDGRLAFLDLGMIGRLSPRSVAGLRQLMASIVGLDADAAIDVCTELGAAGDQVNFQGARQALRQMLTRRHYLPAGQMGLARALGDVVQLINDYDIRLPSEFTLLARALLVAEGVARGLNPDFDYLEVARPFVERMYHEEWSAQRVLSQLGRAARDLRRQLMMIPRRLSHLAGEVESGALRVRVRQEDLARTHALHAALAHRIAASILIAAALVSYAIWATSPVARTWPASWVTGAGVIVGVISSVAALYFLWRSRR